MRGSSSFLRDVPVLLVAVVWGSSFLAVQRVAEPGTVMAMLVLRFGLVLPLLAVVAWRGLRRMGRAGWWGGVVLGSVLGGVFVLETYGAVHTSATNAGLIISLTMVFLLSQRAHSPGRHCRGPSSPPPDWQWWGSPCSPAAVG